MKRLIALIPLLLFLAACHNTAASAEETNWPRILSLYDQLVASTSSSIAALNRAVAVARVRGPQAGLDALAGIRGLDGYHLFHAAQGAFAAELGRTGEALAHFRKAKSIATLPSERAFLERRIAECSA